MSDTEIKIDVKLITDAFTKALATVQKNTDALGKNTEELTKTTQKFGKVSEQAMSGFNSSIMKVSDSFNIMVGNLAADAIRSVFSFISNSISRMSEEARQAEESTNSLNTALRQSGKFSAETSDKMLAFAESLSNVTVYDDDLITANQALLLSLTKLSGDGVNKAVEAAANLSATLGIDLDSATRMVAKAVNGSTESFNKLGINIVKSSDSAQMYNNTMDALAKFTGAAESKTNTYTGALQQSDNALGNLLGSVGQLVTKNPILIEGIQSVTRSFISLTEWITNNKNTIFDLISITTTFVATAGTIVTVLWAVTSGLGAVTAAASATWAALTGPVGLAVLGITAVSAAVTGLVYGYKSLTAETEKHNREVNNTTNITSKATESNKQFIDSLLMGTGVSATENAQRIASNETKLQTIAVDKELSDAEKKQLEEITALKANSRLTEQEAKIAEDAEELMRSNMKFAKLVEDVGLEKAIQFKAQQDLTTNKLEQEKLRLQIQIDTNKKRIEDIKAANKATVDAEAKKLEQQRQGEIKYKSWEEQNQIERQATVKETLGNISGLMSSSNKTAFAIGKAAAMSQATIDGYTAVTKTLASVPYPFNIAAAALVGANAAANLARISAQQPPKFRDGGIVSGNSFSGDMVNARVNSGEMILNRQQQANLFNQINSTGGSSRTDSLLVELINTIRNTNQSIQIDGREIINVVRNGLSSGRSLA